MCLSNDQKTFILYAERKNLDKAIGEAGGPSTEWGKQEFDKSSYA